MNQVVQLKLCSRSIDRLYSCPGVLVRFLEACLERETHQRFAEILQQDAALAARILQAATCCSQKPIPAENPLSAALERLSYDALLAIGIRAAGRYLDERPGLAQSRFRQAFWWQSRVAGVTARCLAEALSYVHVEEAQLAGMLHNIGMQLLFAQDTAHYHAKVHHPSSSPEVCRHEIEAYGVDHRILATQLAETWRLDSFLPEALGFLHHPQVAAGGVLVRLLQLAHALTVSPANLSCEAFDLAERYFELSAAALQEIFADVQRQCEGLPEFAGDLERSHHEEQTAGLHLEKLLLGLAERHACLLQLDHCESLPQLLSEGRSLLRQKLGVQETLFLLADSDKGVLYGMAVTGQSQRIADLQVPLDPTLSLVARCLIEGDVQDSASSVTSEMSMVDRSLLRLSAKPRFVCLPLAMSDQFGVVVIGLDESQDIQAFADRNIQVLCHAIGRGLKKYMQSGLLFGRRSGDRIELRRVAHEINNPLAILGNYVHVLRQQQASVEVLSAMEDEIQRISEILGYYSRQQERSPLPVSQVDIGPLLESVLTSLKPSTLKPRQIAVVVTCDQLPPLAINPIVLRQILINLVKNAAEALPPQGRIDVQCCERVDADGEKHIEIVIADNGPGIPSEQLAQIFNPIKTTKGKGHAGLGLNIVRNMAKDIGVRISCHSRPETGTSFRILIPRHKNQASV